MGDDRQRRAGSVLVLAIVCFAEASRLFAKMNMREEREREREREERKREEKSKQTNRDRCQAKGG
jgi:cysteine sulfinate desulfinase/cysteine desulfurase-like protein